MPVDPQGATDPPREITGQGYSLTAGRFKAPSPREPCPVDPATTVAASLSSLRQDGVLGRAFLSLAPLGRAGSRRDQPAPARPSTNPYVGRPVEWDPVEWIRPTLLACPVADSDSGRFCPQAGQNRTSCSFVRQVGTATRLTYGAVTTIVRWMHRLWTTCGRYVAAGHELLSGSGGIEPVWGDATGVGRQRDRNGRPRRGVDRRDRGSK